jgi:predicted permease
VGVASPNFHGTLLFSSPEFYIPLINQHQVVENDLLNAHGVRWIFQIFGHLKPGVIPEQAASDLTSIGSYLEKTYPRDYSQMVFSLARPGLYGDFMGRPMRAFLSGLMLLAFFILLAACANLGSLFAARAADRSREIAMRVALGASRMRVLRQLFTEAILVSLIGGAIGLCGSLMLLRWLIAWQPFPQFPINLPLTPDLNVYAVALLLGVGSGFLFGLASVKQVLRADPYEIVKSGTKSTLERRITGRDILVVVQIAICAILVTSSMVAVRGLLRSLHSNFGFEPRNAMLVSSGLRMANYRGDAAATMQKRITEALETIPGVTSIGWMDWVPLTNGAGSAGLVFADETTDLIPTRAVTSMMMKVSTDYFQAANTRLLMGRTFRLDDDADAPEVGIVNKEFARKFFGHASNALNRYFKMKDGRRIQVVGVVEDGKYGNMTEDPKLAVFLPILQSPAPEAWIVVRSNADPQQLAGAIKIRLLALDKGLPLFLQTWNEAMNLTLFPARAATFSLGILGLIGAILSITGIFGIASYSVSKRMRDLGIRMALGAQRKQVLQAALGRALKLLACGSVAGVVLGIFGSRVLSSIVFQATPRDPFVLAAVVLTMTLLGLLATWIPAQRALSAQPLMLLREE